MIIREELHPVLTDTDISTCCSWDKDSITGEHRKSFIIPTDSFDKTLDELEVYVADLKAKYGGSARFEINCDEDAMDIYFLVPETEAEKAIRLEHESS